LFLDDAVAAVTMLAAQPMSHVPLLREFSQAVYQRSANQAAAAASEGMF
jgi:hypothetical protein